MFNLDQLALTRKTRIVRVHVAPTQGRPISAATLHVMEQAGTLKIGETELFNLTAQHIRSIINRRIKRKQFTIRTVDLRKCLLTRIK